MCEALCTHRGGGEEGRGPAFTELPRMWDFQANTGKFLGKWGQVRWSPYQRDR